MLDCCVCERWWLHKTVVCLSKVGSPSALADCDLNQELRRAAQNSGRTLYIPSGALWGGQDIQRLNDSGGLEVTAAGLEAEPRRTHWKEGRSSYRLLSPEFVYQDVQASVLFPADGRRALWLDGGWRPARFIQRIRGGALPAGSQQRQHHGSRSCGGRNTGLHWRPGRDCVRHGVSSP